MQADIFHAHVAHCTPPPPFHPGVCPPPFHPGVCRVHIRIVSLSRPCPPPPPTPTNLQVFAAFKLPRPFPSLSPPHHQVFAAFIGIIAGLGITLLCLAVYRRALPTFISSYPSPSRSSSGFRRLHRHHCRAGHHTALPGGLQAGPAGTALLNRAGGHVLLHHRDGDRAVRDAAHDTLHFLLRGVIVTAYLYMTPLTANYTLYLEE